MDNNSTWIILDVCILIGLVSIIGKLRTDIKDMRLTLDRIAKQVGVPDIITKEVKDELINLILKGKKVKAIKRYRMLTGLGLKEAKEYIDQLDLNKIEQV